MEMKGTPAAHGYRMPAEWEPHSQCWMGWPVSSLFFFFFFFSSLLIAYLLMNLYVDGFDGFCK